MMTSLRRYIGHYVVLAIFLSTLSGPGWAKPVSTELAYKVAKAWLACNQDRLSASAPSPQLTASGIRPFRNAVGQVLAYIVDLQPKGFVVVPADDLVEPILTYGTEGNFAGILGPGQILADMLVQDIPWRISRAKSVQTAYAGRDQYVAKVAARWARFSGAPSRQSLDAGGLDGAVTPVVNPLIKDTWDQGDPGGPYTYNYYTPKHYVTGCVATAMGMIIHFHKYPAAASGTNVIAVDDQPQQASFDSTYNYDLMPTALYANTPENQVQEVAKLLYDCGISVRMQYGADGSAAMTSYVATALKSTFKYTSADWKDGESGDWATVLKDELNAGFPVEMSIRDTENASGHAIVCDGWGTEDNEDRFHLNMGWSGQMNNWYQVPGFTTGHSTWDLMNGYVYNVRSPITGKITCTVTGPASPTKQSPISFTITFSETVTGLTADEINVTGGTKGALTPTGDAAVYTLPVTPAQDGNVTCSVPAGAAQGSGDKGNEASNICTIRSDGTAPTCEVTGPAKYTGFVSVDFLIRFSEPVTGLTAGEVSVAGGTAGVLSGTGDTYTLSVSPTLGQNVTCQVPAGVAQDAAGNLSTASNAWTATYDPGGPVVEISSPTRNAAYASDTAVIDLSGSASAPDGIASVAWVNNRGGEGACSGTTLWSATGIELQVGQNTITVTATAVGGRTGTDAIYVTYTPSNLVQISISPGNIGLAAGAQQQFRVFRVDPSGVETPATDVVTWSSDVDAGNVDNAGLFTAGALANTYGAAVTASIPDASARSVPVEVFVARSEGGHVAERWWGRTPADRIDYARDVAVDAGGCVYIVDQRNHRVQEFDVTGSYVRHWGSEGSGPGQFRSPTGIAVDSSGGVYVVDTGNSRVQKFSASGEFILEWGSAGTGDGEFQSPEAITVDANGGVYVVDTGNCRVQKFSSTGQFELKFGSSGTGNGQFSVPGGIAVDAVGSIYVSDRSSTNVRIQKFNAAGEYVTKWGSYGTGNGQFTSIRDVAVDASESANVYAVDGAGRIQRFNSEGGYIGKWGSVGTGDGQFDSIWAVTTDASGAVYVADVGNSRVQKFDSLGNYAGKWGSTSGLGQFKKPGAVAVDTNGDVYVVDARNSRIQKFDAYGDFIICWGADGVGDGQFKNPSGVAVDAEGSVYVTDTNNHRVQRFSPSGSFVAQWGSYGKNDRQFYYPVGVAVDGSGYIYVSDRWGRVQKFTSEGVHLRTMFYNGGVTGGAESLGGIAIDVSGNVYVADETGDCVQKFDTNGTYKGKWGTQGSGAGQLRQPKAVAVDASGYVYVVDTQNSRVQKFSGGGTYITHWGASGTAVGQFDLPGGAAIDEAGNVFVADTENNRVQKFRPYASALAPVIISPTGAPTYFTSDATLNVAGTAVQDAVLVSWANDRGGGGSCVGTTSWSANGIQLYAGANRITVTAQDAQGNTGESALVVTYDSVSPTVTIESPTSEPVWSTVDGLLSIAGTADDDQAVTRVSWSNDRGGEGMCTGTTAWMAADVPLAPGQNVITVTAQDAVGNASSDTIVVSFTDTVMPMVTILLPTAEDTYSTVSPILSMAGEAVDNGSIAEVTWVNSRGGAGVCAGAASWSASGIPLLVGLNIITVTATDAAGNSGNDVLAVILADTTAPVVAIATPTAGPTYETDNSAITIGGTASDDVAVTQVTWENDRGGSGACTGTSNWSAANVALSLGQNVITVTARDAAGNTATDTITVTSTAPQPPTVTITGPTSQPTFSTNSTTTGISGLASDDVGVVSVTWADNHGQSGVCTGTTNWGFTAIPLSVGHNIITVTATDTIGLTATDTLTVIFTDNTAPTVTIASPTTAATWTTTSPTLSIGGTASDDVAVTGVSWSNDRGGSGACSGTTEWTAAGINLALGQNVITVSASDSSGNRKTASLVVTRDDDSIPSVMITSPTSETTFSAAIEQIDVSGSASDDAGIVSVVWENDRGGSGTCAGTTLWQATAIPLKVGDNVITVTATDAAGNAGLDVLTITLDDFDAPTVTITGPTSLPTYSTSSGAIAISGVASDNFEIEQVSWCNDRTTCGMCTGTTSWGASGIQLEVGQNTITVTARDAAGNESTDTLIVTATDGTPPTVAFSTPTSESAYATTASTLDIGGSAGDNVGVTSVSWSNDRGGSGACAGTTSWTAAGVPLKAGQNVITVTARDAAGNTGVSSLTVTCSDATPPSVTITAPTTAATYTTSSSTLTIGGTASDNVGLASVTWADGRGGGGTCTGTTNWSATGIALVLGANTITVTATDTAGQTATDVIVVTCVDSLPPVVQITAPTSDSSCSMSCGTLTIRGTASDNFGLTTVTWSNSKGGSGVCTGTESWSAVVGLVPGVNVITVRVSDAADNIGVDVIAIDYEDYTEQAATAWRGLAMVSIPIVPDVTDPKEALGFYGDRWMVFDTLTNAYIGYANDTAHRTWFEPAAETPGRGFWAYFETAGTLPCGSLPRQDLAASIPLRSGWNLIGQPFVSAVEWDLHAIRVRSGSDERTLEQAFQAGWMKDYAWGWTPDPTEANIYNGAYYLVADESVAPGSVHRLEPWQAYWVRAYRDCTLILPGPEDSGAPPPPPLDD